MDTANKILTGSTVPHKISLPTQLVTKDNAADYLAHLLAVAPPSRDY